MSEKRFEMKGNTHIFDSKTSEEYYAPSEYELVNLLNNLTEENEKLHMENTKLLSERIKDLEEFGEGMIKAEKMAQEILQLKTQIVIFETFLEENDLDVIEWEEFCTLDSCIFDEPNFSCKECVYIGRLENE